MAAAVSVSTRLRPVQHRSSEAPSTSVDQYGTVTVHGKQFDGFLTSVITGSDQAMAYETIGVPLLQQLECGYSCTLLAYGQTGSGKTYTIFGPTGSLTEASLLEPLDLNGAPPLWGLLPRMALALLATGTTVHASAVEIYNEQAFDLLADRACAGSAPSSEHVCRPLPTRGACVTPSARPQTTSRIESCHLQPTFGRLQEGRKERRQRPYVHNKQWIGRGDEWRGG